MIEETYVLAFQVKGRTPDGKEALIGRRYNSRSAAETLAALIKKDYAEVWVSEIIGKDGIT